MVSIEPVGIAMLQEKERIMDAATIAKLKHLSIHMP